MDEPTKRPGGFPGQLRCGLVAIPRVFGERAIEYILQARGQVGIERQQPVWSIMDVCPQLLELVVAPEHR